MSKSLGNVLNPHDLIKQYGVDYVRYFLASEIHFGNDGDFSHESFTNKINAELANDLGNLVNRVLTLIQKNFDSKLPPIDERGLTAEDISLLEAARETLPQIRTQLAQLNIKTICDLIINLAKQGNKYIDTQAPWALIKTDKARAQTVLNVLMETLRIIGIYLEPVVPAACGRMMDQMGIPQEFRTFASIFHSLPADITVQPPTPVFPRIEVESAADMNSDVVSSEDKKGEKKVKATKASENGPTSAELSDLVQKYASVDDKSVESWLSVIQNVGEQIRTMKAAKASKSELAPIVNELNYVKERYRLANGGIAYDPKAK